MDSRFSPIKWLKDAGARAYIVGNQTRAKLLAADYDPKDIDIATDARSTSVIKVLRRHNVIPTQVNATFGVVSFSWQGQLFEITTFRRDIYDPQFNHIKRSPQQVVFVEELALDAERRDFTINAIYWDPTTGKVFDPLNGQADLKAKLIRLIGDPDIRLKEDPIRILRAIRFRHGLGFKYTKETRAAIKRQAQLIHKLPPSLIKREFQKIQSLPRYSAARREMQGLKLIGRF